MRLKRFAAAAAMLSASLAARADTVTTFTVKGRSFYYGSIFDDYNRIAGTITIDTTNGTVEAYSVVAGGEADSGVTGQIDSSFFSDSSIVQLSGSLVGYTGGDFTSVGPNDIYDGRVRVTPEPSSFLLLGSGVLGAAGVMRKRYS